MVIKNVDDILITGPDEEVRQFIFELDDQFELPTITADPGHLQFYGLNVIQNENHTCSIDADDTANAIELYPRTFVRLQQYDEEMNELERLSFMAINESIGWIGITARPLHYFYSSFLKQEINYAIVSLLIHQISVLNILISYGTLTHYVRLRTGINMKVFSIGFADAGHSELGTELGFITALMIGDI